MANKPLKSIKFPGLPDTYIIEGLPSNAKAALLDCFAHVAWIDEHGQDYYDALYNALYGSDEDNKIKVFFGKGTSGSNIVDNAKRFLTEPILFDTNSPLTIQYSGCVEYNIRYGVKIIDNQGNIWVYDSSKDEYEIFWRKDDDVTTQADGVFAGWITDADKIVSGKRVDDIQNIYEKTKILNTNGSIRILFADIESLDNTPDYNIGGTLVVQGRSYILEGRDKNEFI